MAITPKTLAVAGGATGSIGAVGAGIYVATKGESITIKDLIGSHAITSPNEFEKRFETKGEDTPPPEVTDKTKLKDWCENHYKTPATKEIEENTELINKIKKWCIPTIKQKLGEDFLSTSTETSSDDSSHWKIKAKNLKDYGEFWGEKDLDLTSIKTTKDSIVDPTSNSDTTWHKLRDWCKDKYKENFEGENNNLWKLAKKFCTKATIKDAIFDNELPITSNLNEVWDARVTAALVDKSTSSNPGTKDDSLRTDLGGDDANKKRLNLQTWCSNQYLQKHDATFGESSSKTNLIDEVKKWCVVLIKEKIEANNKFTSFTNSENEWTNRVTALSGYADSNPALTTTLTAIKTTTGNNADTTKKTKLQAWCKDVYDRGYKGESNNLFLLAKKFCTKNGQ